MSSDEWVEQQPEAPTSAPGSSSNTTSSRDPEALTPAQQRRQALKTPEYKAWWSNQLTDRVWLPQPNLWQRFQDQMRGKADVDGPNSISGANITLEDVARWGDS
jgi:hypothetical protein